MTKRRVSLGIVALLVALVFIAALHSLVATSSASSVPPKKAATAATAANGAKQAAVHSASVTTPPLVPFIRSLSLHIPGCECPTVFQLQRALKAAGVRPKTQKATGYYGALTAKQVAAFQRKVKIKPATGRYGSKTHHALSKFYDLAGRQRLQALAHTRKIVAIQHALKVVGEHFLQVGGTTLAYSQSASRGIIPKYPGVPPATDCSGLVTAVYKDVGLPDPNGQNYNPIGWTGTLGQHGVRVTNWAKLRIGDLVLYGGGFPYGHVAMIIDAAKRLVISHGSRGVKLLPFNYRRVSVIRRYY